MTTFNIEAIHAQTAAGIRSEVHMCLRSPAPTWAKAESLTFAAGMWETYVNDPSGEPDPSTWRTLITWPLA